MWLQQNHEDLLEYIQSRLFSSCKGITKIDFSTLYITIYHSKGTSQHGTQNAKTQNRITDLLGKMTFVWIQYTIY
jgi:hypothetical protein